MNVSRTVWLALALGAHASVAQAEDAANVQQLIRAGEETLRREPYLAQYCARFVALRNGDAFFHRQRYRDNKPPVVLLARWEAYVNQQVQSGRITRAQGDALIQEARRRRNEVNNACHLEDNKALLAKARQPAPGVSGVARLIWNQDADANHAIHADGTVSGNAASWTFSGTGTPSWDSSIRARVDCSGTSAGLGPEGGRENGSWTCRAQWTENGKPAIRECKGPGVGRGYGWNATKAWFVSWPSRCVGTITGADGKPIRREFGYMLIPVPSQDSPLDF